MHGHVRLHRPRQLGSVYLRGIFSVYVLDFFIDDVFLASARCA